VTTEKGEIQCRAAVVLVGARAGSGPTRVVIPNNRRVGRMFGVRISCEEWSSEFHTNCDKNKDDKCGLFRFSKRG
jgi:hypothetical protein